MRFVVPVSQKTRFLCCAIGGCTTGQLVSDGVVQHQQCQGIPIKMQVVAIFGKCIEQYVESPAVNESRHAAMHRLSVTETLTGWAE